MAKKIKIDKELYEKIRDAISNQPIIDKLIKEISELKEQMYNYQSQYIQTTHENKQLHRENALLKKMFEEAKDTQAIKYNDKLFLIRSRMHYQEQGEEETLNIDAVYSNIKVEVNEDGESEV